MNLLQEITNIVDSNSSDELTTPVHKKGSKFQRNRISYICEATLKQFDGDILEIGCHTGMTTVVLCKLARKYNRRVYAVDPYDGNQQGNEDVFKHFTERTKDYIDVLSFFRYKSQDPVIHELINDSNICFSFVDGLHTYDACKADIELCKNNTGTMCVDDLGWHAGIRRLFEEYSFDKYYNPLCREGYYVID